MNKKILIVDANNNMHRAYHKYANMKNGGIKTSIIWGLPYIINSHLKKIRPDKLLMIWDGQKHPERIKINPGYKLKRASLSDYQDMISQKERVIEFFHNLGVPQFFDSRFEADDIIYRYTRIYLKKGYDVQILSMDKDFHQLLKPGVTILNHMKETILTHNNLQRYFSYTPKQCVDYLCLDGDTSDNIPGYPGMGEKSIAKFFEEFPSIKHFLESDKEFKKLDKKKLLEIYQNNRKMIDLRLFYNEFIKGKMKPRYYKGIKKPVWSDSFIESYCEDHNIKTFNNPMFLNTFKTLLI